MMEVMMPDDGEKNDLSQSTLKGSRIPQ